MWTIRNISYWLYNADERYFFISYDMSHDWIFQRAINLRSFSLYERPYSSEKRTKLVKERARPAGWSRTREANEDVAINIKEREAGKTARFSVLNNSFYVLPRGQKLELL